MKRTVFARPAMRRTIEWTALIILAAMISACGARQRADHILPALPASDELPQDATSLDALRTQDPSSPEAAFLRAYVHLLYADIAQSFDALMSPQLDDAPPMLRLGRLALMVANYDDLIDDSGLVAWSNAYASREMFPQERVLFVELQRALALRNMTREDAAELPSARPLGGAEQWTVVGAISSTWTDEILTQGAAASVETLQDLPLQGRQRRFDYPTKVGGLPYNPHPGNVAYYESFLRVDEPTRVAITRFGAQDNYSVWIDDTLVLQRGAQDTNDASYHLPVLDLDQGVYRVLMVVRSSDEQVQPPHVIALEGEIAAFSSDEGPAQAGRVTEVNIAHASLTEALAPVRENDVLTWLVHAAIAMLSDDALGYALTQQEVETTHPLIALVRAHLYERIRDLPGNDSLALQAVRSVDPAWPEFPGLVLKDAQLVFGASEDRDAAQRLATWADADDASPHVRAAYGYMLRRLRLNALAMQVYDALVEDYPMWCDAWSDRLRMMLQHRGILTREDFQDAPEFCSDVRWLKLAVTEQWRGESANYIAALERSLARAADNPRAAIDAFWQLLKSDGVDRAEAYLDTLNARGLEDEDLLAESSAIVLLREGSEGFERLVEQFAERWPERQDVRMVLARLSAQRIFSDLRPDPTPILETYRASEGSGNSKAELVYIYDYGVWKLFESGGGVRIQHQLIELNSNNAIVQAGEIGIPDGAEVLELRIIKPDGSTRSPESSEDKSSLSMPNMEIGDVLERELLEFFPPPADGDITFRSDPFYFQMYDAPMVFSQMRIDYPEAWKDDVVVERFNFEGAYDTTVKDGYIQERMTVQDQSSALTEHWAPELLEVGPWARFSAFGSLEREIQSYGDRVLPRVAPAPEIDALARALIGKKKKEEEVLRALFRFVIDEVESTSVFFNVSARETARAEQGDRLALLYALAKSAGFQPELAFVQSFDMPKIESPIVSTENFDSIALRIRGKKKTYWFELQNEHAAFDHLSSYAQDRPALIITGDARGEIVRTPDHLWDDVRETVDAELWLDADGNARFEHTLFGGDELSIYVRALLEYEPNAQRRRDIFEGYLGGLYGDVTLDELTIDGEDDPEAPIALHLKGTIGNFATVRDGTLILDHMFDETLLLWGTTASSARALPILISNPVLDVLNITLHPPENHRVSRGLSTVELAYDAHRYTREVASDTRDSVSWTRTVRLQRGRILPEAYAAYAAFGQKARTAERVRIEWTSVP